MRSPATRAAPLLLLLLSPRLLLATGTAHPAPATAAASALSPRPPIPPTFAANRGQLDDPGTEFLSRGDGFEVRLNRTGAALALAAEPTLHRPRATLPTRATLASLPPAAAAPRTSSPPSPSS